MNPRTHGQCANCGESAPYTKLVCNRCGARLPWVGEATSEFARQGVTVQDIELLQDPLLTRYRQRHLTALETLGVLCACAIIFLGLVFPNTHSRNSSESASAAVSASMSAPAVDAPFGIGSGESANTAVEVTNVSQIPAATRALFDKIETGMTLPQVQSILGVSSVEIRRDWPSRRAVYTWRSFHGADVEATFQNERLTKKAIFGLY